MLSDVVVDRILQILRAGGYVVSAVRAAGVSRVTFYEWMRRGDPAGSAPEDEQYREFRSRVEQARAESEARNVALIAQAAQTNWQAAAWLIERQYPERWSRPSQRAKPDDIGAAASAAAHVGDVGDMPSTDDPLDALDSDELAPRRARRR